MKVVILIALTLVIMGVPASFAHPPYVSNLNTEYGVSSCGTCHVTASGGGPLTSYGTLFQNQPDHAADPSAALKAIGAPPTANPTVIATATLTTPAVTTVTTTATPMSPVATSTPAAPGFGIWLSLIGLFAWSLLAKRKNK